MKVHDQLEFADLQNLAAAPASPTVGRIYFDTVLTQFFYWDGAAWRAVIIPAAAQTLTNKTIDAALNILSNIADVNVAAGAAIARSKLANGTNNHVIINSPGGVLSSEAQLSVARGGTGQATVAAAFQALSPLTTKGDLVTQDAANPARIGVGANGTVLTADSTQTVGVKWAVPAVASYATEVDMETATSNVLAATPGTTQFHPGVAKAFASFGESGGVVSIGRSYGVLSITDNGNGDYTINFSTAFSDSNYAMAGSGKGVASTNSVLVTEQMDTPTRTASNHRIYTLAMTSGTPTDFSSVSVVYFGDQ